MKEKQGVIDLATRERIEAVVQRAPIGDFSPLLLVIPYALVSTLMKAADVAAAAKSTSEEYIIYGLQGTALTFSSFTGDA